mmetsp:Transcript_8211/g.12210  ORF Transcript_8211/g.12210 Transcript_8211/m.12210 type:complete len:85 (-) Transcript_8211:16-270(-)
MRFELILTWLRSSVNTTMKTVHLTGKLLILLLRNRSLGYRDLFICLAARMSRECADRLCLVQRSNTSSKHAQSSEEMINSLMTL